MGALTPGDILDLDRLAGDGFTEVRNATTYRLAESRGFDFLVRFESPSDDLALQVSAHERRTTGNPVQPAGCAFTAVTVSAPKEVPAEVAETLMVAYIRPHIFAGLHRMPNGLVFSGRNRNVWYGLFKR